MTQFGAWVRNAARKPVKADSSHEHDEQVQPEGEPHVTVSYADLVRLFYVAMNDTEPSLQPTLTRVAAIIRDAA